MKQAYFRFYAELNDFLPAERRMLCFAHYFHGRQTVKSLIEDLGIPHTEVDVILVNGRSVDFSQKLEDGDTVSVYPTFESLDVSQLIRLRPEPLRQIRFVADVHLGRLAAYLRLLGFDTQYSSSMTDKELTRISCDERRILLTRDRELLKHRELTHALYVRATHPRQQLAELVQRLNLGGLIKPFSRCLRCNEILLQIDKECVIRRLPALVAEKYGQFHQCPTCSRIYWPGTHYRRMQQFLIHYAGWKPAFP